MSGPKFTHMRLRYSKGAYYAFATEDCFRHNEVACRFPAFSDLLEWLNENFKETQEELKLQHPDIGKRVEAKYFQEGNDEVVFEVFPIIGRLVAAMPGKCVIIDDTGEYCIRNEYTLLPETQTITVAATPEKIEALKQNPDYEVKE